MATITTVLGGALGDGQYGRVHTAVLVEDGVAREVAVKTFKVKLADGKKHKNTIGRRREVTHLTALPRHPRVLHADVVYTDAHGCLCIATPLARTSLWHEVGRRSVRADDVLRWSADVIAGVAHLHRHRVMHRDLKLDNVFVDRGGGAVVADLGVARFVGAVGSADFSSTVCVAPLRPPECFLARLRDADCEWMAYGPELDSWALGFTLLALASGNYLLKTDEGADAREALAAILAVCGRPPALDFEGEFPPYELAARADRLRALARRDDLPRPFWLTAAALLDVAPSRRASVVALADTPFWSRLVSAEPLEPEAAAAARGALGRPVALDASNVLAWGDRRAAVAARAFEDMRAALGGALACSVTASAALYATARGRLKCSAAVVAAACTLVASLKAQMQRVQPIVPNARASNLVALAALHVASMLFGGTTPHAKAWRAVLPRTIKKRAYDDLVDATFRAADLSMLYN